VRRLLAGYPNLGAHDPEGYIAALVAVMVEYPAWAGQRTILKVDEENTDFPPTDKRLRKWLDDAVRPYRFAEEWNARTAEQLAERTTEAAASKAAPQEHRGKIVTCNDPQGQERPIGAFEQGRQLAYRG